MWNASRRHSHAQRALALPCSRSLVFGSAAGEASRAVLHGLCPPPPPVPQVVLSANPLCPVRDLPSPVQCRPFAGSPTSSLLRPHSHGLANSPIFGSLTLPRQCPTPAPAPAPGAVPDPVRLLPSPEAQAKSVRWDVEAQDPAPARSRSPSECEAPGALYTPVGCETLSAPNAADLHSPVRLGPPSNPLSPVHAGPGPATAQAPVPVYLSGGHTIPTATGAPAEEGAAPPSHEHRGHLDASESSSGL